jgi:hypothetical protein
MSGKTSICVYRDTIEKDYKWNYDINLSYVIVTEDFVKQYFNECKSNLFKDIEEFLYEYTADDVEDFYDYAVKHNAVIAVENW